MHQINSQRRLLPIVTSLACLLITHSGTFAQPTPAPVNIQVDLTKQLGPVQPIWSWFGYDEPNYTYMKDGKKLLTELAGLSKMPVYVRVHSLLVTGDGTAALKWGSTNAYTEDAQGKPVYNWTIIDKIFDTYIERGMKPIAQIGFMPEALSAKPAPYRHYWKPGDKYDDIYTGWAYPPKDYTKWARLVEEWVKHSVARYGKPEVESWYWELWNEPNIGYWKGTTDEYIKLYDYTADAVKRTLPTARIGGPEVTGPNWDVSARFFRTFLDHIVGGKNYATGKTGAPLDFITFHAKGAPKVVDGVVRMDMGAQFRDLDKGFAIVASYPSLKKLPIIIGESDPEGCAACSEDLHPQNAYRNGTMYSSYSAAAFARKSDMAGARGVNLRGAVTWAFEFEDQAWFRGFRDLATNGVDKPVLNVFRMFGMMRGNRVAVNSVAVNSVAVNSVAGQSVAVNSVAVNSVAGQSTGSYDFQKIRDGSVRAGPDINGFAAKDAQSATVMVWNYHDDNKPAPDSPVAVRLKGLPGQKMLVEHYRIDGQHSNSYEVWKKMGSPKSPSPAQVAELEQAGQLQLLTSPVWMSPKNGEAVFDFPLPRQGVSLLKLSWP